MLPQCLVILALEQVDRNLTHELSSWEFVLILEFYFVFEIFKVSWEDLKSPHHQHEYFDLSNFTLFTVPFAFLPLFCV